ncbi:hypothetical protein GXP70_13210 [Paenibacillus lycopersici]|uniref:histidine kinase n=1 Tax=Paenibacillus lycopersici TaxID=2704462 RepID=A0A6C0FXN5_9BACL|nr:histidine kinase [Paenibacillus lycopersici]QHT60812.1 hypothetical protein GXP70_13210 [Paenibacillus lycopersici]
MNRWARQVQELLPYTLKFRLILMLVMSVMIPLLVIGAISYYGLYNLLQNKVERGVDKNLEQERNGLDSILSNLDYSSRQLAFEGKVGKDLEAYLKTDDPLDKQHLGKEIEDYISLINYTNPLLGLTAYYLPDSKQFLFENLYINPKLDLNSFHAITSQPGKYTLNGPHQTLYVNSKNAVFSIMRETDSNGGAPAEPPIFVYIETNVSTIADLFNSEPYGMPVTHLLLDQNGKIIYRSGNDSFPVGADYKTLQAERKNDAVFFETTSKYGIKLAIVIANGDYHKEMNTWLKRFAIAGLVSLLLGLLIGRIIWTMIYRPLQRIRKQFKMLGENRFNEPPDAIHIKEFDELLAHFYDMRKRIRGLMSEIEVKETRKRHLEVEKLMYQINPHFIHNTLNTAQWLARMNGQDEIVKLLTVFTRVLNYNLGKEGQLVTVRDEIQTVRDYIDLQQMRYNYQFHIIVDAETDTEAIVVPRFLLQPIVENAMYHGFKNKDGMIQVTVRMAEDRRSFVLEVKDNGEGMAPEKVSELFAADDGGGRRKVGLGIGLSFVNNIVRVYYGEQYGLEVVSELGVGTAMRLKLPVVIKEGWNDDQDIDRGR